MREYINSILTDGATGHRLGQASGHVTLKGAGSIPARCDSFHLLYCKFFIHVYPGSNVFLALYPTARVNYS